MSATSGAEVRDRPARAWSRTEGVLILGGPDLGTPLAERPVAGEVLAPQELTELRALTTTGEFTGDICRRPGSPTIALLDAAGEFIGAGSLHGGQDIPTGSGDGWTAPGVQGPSPPVFGIPCRGE
ncbi:hypothetical protein [Streptomyces sp. NPDC002550]